MKFLAAIVSLSLTSVSFAARAQSQNSIYIDQIGDGAKVTILQDGNRNRIGDSLDVPAVLGGASGTTAITQNGDENVVSGSVTVRDGSNAITVVQQGNRNVYDYGRTVGARNTIALAQFGSDNAVGTSVGGQDNQLSIRQDGRVNNARLIAYGDGNVLTAFSKGDGNTIRLRSEGSNNVLSVRQAGAGHTAVINQTGNNATLAITQR